MRSVVVLACLAALIGAPAAARGYGHAHAGFHAHKAKKVRTFHPVKRPKKLKLFSDVEREPRARKH